MVINRLSAAGYGSPEGVQNGYRGGLYTDLTTGFLWQKTTLPGTLTGWIPCSGGVGPAGPIQVFNSTTAVPDDPAKPALRYPAHGGVLEQWDIGNANWI